MTTTDAITAANELFDYDPARAACPYPVFKGLREEAPVRWFDLVQAFVVSRYDLIVEVLRQPEIFSNRSATGPATEQEMANVMLELAMEDPSVGPMAEAALLSSVPTLLLTDPPEHGRQRALVNRAFTPAVIRRIEPQMQELADELVDRFAATGRTELLADFAVPFPMTVIARALGVSLDRMDDFIRWSATMVAGIGKRHFEKAQMREFLVARTELADYLQSVIAARDAEPQDDLISQIVHSTIDDERLTHIEVMNMALQFLLAGNDTTAKLIATSMLRLAGDPELADRLRGEGDLVPAFVEEMLRLEPPINGLWKIADADYELDGVKIPAGSTVFLLYASGNRDPQQYPDPDGLTCPQPSKSPHLAFGFGEHFCLGASLARGEARIAISTLLRRLGDIRLDVPADQVKYDVSFMLHGLQELPLAFTPTTP